MTPGGRVISNKMRSTDRVIDFPKDFKDFNHIPSISTASQCWEFQNFQSFFVGFPFESIHLTCGISLNCFDFLNITLVDFLNITLVNHQTSTWHYPITGTYAQNYARILWKSQLWLWARQGNHRALICCAAPCTKPTETNYLEPLSVCSSSTPKTMLGFVPTSTHW